MAGLVIAASIFSMVFAPTAAMLRGKGASSVVSVQGFDMHPEVVARLLTQVGQRWVESRVAVLLNETEELAALTEMKTSCAKVAQAIVEGSEGDKDRVIEYMHDVCDEDKATTAERAKCEKFSKAIEGIMDEDPEVNRDLLNFPEFCQKFWGNEVTDAARVEVEEHDVEEATSKTRAADQDAVKVNKEIKAMETEMAIEAEDANKLGDRARNELQTSLEKEAKLSEEKEAKVEAEAKAEEERKEEAKAELAAANAKAEEEANANAKAEEEAKAESAKTALAAKKSMVAKAAVNIQDMAQDELAAMKAGDAEAEKIVEKARKEEQAAMKAEKKKLVVHNKTAVNQTKARKA